MKRYEVWMVHPESDSSRKLATFEGLAQAEQFLELSEECKPVDTEHYEIREIEFKEPR